ncbi:hypothetical protein DPMN_077777 [Dreissena polymorpha]|uniref:Homeobox domain-containing protein n=1 Tax=Dreissena polymorpha TaxID=45954 RepID=A0A9D4BPY0_DREPO|nr:hypothetical protein DPMN_077777 [Dreissena polymorpha]
MLICLFLCHTVSTVYLSFTGILNTHTGKHNPNNVISILSVQRRRRRENRQRRQRTTFTSDQTLKLELEYARTDNVSRHRRFEFAGKLQLTESQIKIWFQNRRAKDKRIEKAQIDHTLR